MSICRLCYTERQGRLQRNVLVPSWRDSLRPQQRRAFLFERLSGYLRPRLRHGADRQLVQGLREDLGRGGCFTDDVGHGHQERMLSWAEKGGEREITSSYIHAFSQKQLTPDAILRWHVDNHDCMTHVILTWKFWSIHSILPLNNFRCLAFKYHSSVWKGHKELFGCLGRRGVWPRCCGRNASIHRTFGRRLSRCIQGAESRGVLRVYCRSINRRWWGGGRSFERKDWRRKWARCLAAMSGEIILHLWFGSLPHEILVHIGNLPFELDKGFLPKRSFKSGIFVILSDTR